MAAAGTPATKRRSGTGGRVRAGAPAASRAGPSTDPGAPDPPQRPVVNQVLLHGRLTGVRELELPSGDPLLTARLVVPRAGGGVDTIECALWRASVRRTALRVPDGATVEVEGSLHRRFFRAATGPASRYEVEVTALRRVPAG